jgi:hypothetical protein
METIILCCTNSNGWLNWLNLGLAIFAALIAIGYFLKPRIHYAIYRRTKENKIKWVAEVKNKNLLPLTVKEIKCEIAVSETIEFTVAKRLELLKDETLILKKDRSVYHTNYIFVPVLEIAGFTGYTFIRIRLLATNILGVKKHYERICRINGLPDEDHKILTGNCNHKRLTKQLIREERNNQNNHA